VVLVVHANQCSRKIILRSQQSLEEVGAKILGVVLNRVDTRSPDYYYSYKYYGAYKTTEAAEHTGNKTAPTA
jgi:Mrp family chromosome partitioning ATPase